MVNCCDIPEAFFSNTALSKKKHTQKTATWENTENVHQAKKMGVFFIS